MAAAAAAVVVFHRNKLPIYLHLSDVVFVAVAAAAATVSFELCVN